jgi:hypothetical protein
MDPRGGDDLRARLLEIAHEEHAWPKLADVAIRRWRSFPRRSKPRHRTPELRVRDLARGLTDSLGEDALYLGPGDALRLAERFAEVLPDGD